MRLAKRQSAGRARWRAQADAVANAWRHSARLLWLVAHGARDLSLCAQAGVTVVVTVASVSSAIQRRTVGGAPAEPASAPGRPHAWLRWSTPGRDLDACIASAVVFDPAIG